MAVEIVMPRVDMDMTSGRMGRWHAAEGAHVEKGATLFEIETDKAAMEVDAPASGVLKFVAASEGDVLPVGACIGWIVADGESFASPPATEGVERDDVESARGARPHPALRATFSQGEKGKRSRLPLGEGLGVRVSAAVTRLLPPPFRASALARHPIRGLHERRRRGFRRP